MFIKVKQCSYKDTWDLEYWYRNMIGKDFKVIWESDFYYFVVYDGGNKANFINKKDIE